MSPQDYAIEYNLYNESSRREINKYKNYETYYAILNASAWKLLLALLGLNVIKYIVPFGARSVLKLFIYILILIYMAVVVFFTWLDVNARDEDNMSNYLFKLNQDLLD